MKKILIIMLLTATSVMAGGPLDSFRLAVSNVPTNAAAAVGSTNIWGVLGADVTPDTVSGQIQTIIVGFSGATARDIDIDVRTRASGNLGVSRTILTLDDVTADGEYIVVQPTVETDNSTATNWYKNMTLFSDEVEAVVYDSNKTNVNVSITVIMK